MMALSGEAGHRLFLSTRDRRAHADYGLSWFRRWWQAMAGQAIPSKAYRCALTDGQGLPKARNNMLLCKHGLMKCRGANWLWWMAHGDIFSAFYGIFCSAYGFAAGYFLSSLLRSRPAQRGLADIIRHHAAATIFADAWNLPSRKRLHAPAVIRLMLFLTLQRILAAIPIRLGRIWLMRPCAFSFVATYFSATFFWPRFSGLEEQPLHIIGSIGSHGPLGAARDSTSGFFIIYIAWIRRLRRCATRLWRQLRHGLHFTPDALLHRHREHRWLILIAPASDGIGFSFQSTTLFRRWFFFRFTLISIYAFPHAMASFAIFRLYRITISQVTLRFITLRAEHALIISFQANTSQRMPLRLRSPVI